MAGAYLTKRGLYAAVDRLRCYLSLDNESPQAQLRGIVEKQLPVVVEEHFFRTPGLHGMASIGNPDVILLNARYGAEIKRFDFAHELFHCVYHRAGASSFRCYGAPRSSQETYLEWQANEAAAELLIPYRSFIPMVADVHIKCSRALEDFIYQWAAYYNVTTTQVKMRLEGLKYEIYQNRQGVNLADIKILSRAEQQRSGLQVLSLVDYYNRLVKRERRALWRKQEAEKFDPSYGSTACIFDSVWDDDMRDFSIWA